MHNEERLAREALVGWDRARLENARVVVAGAGAAGNNAVQVLSLCHVGELRIVDADRYDASNVSRSPLLGRGQQHHGVVGKAEELARAALDVHGAQCPTIRHAHARIEELGYGAFEGADVIVSAVDSFAVRGYLATAARRLGVPFVEMGFREPFGHASIVPNGDADQACFHCFQPRASVARAPCSLYARRLESAGRVPATQPLAAAVSAFAASFIIRAIHGDLPPEPVVSTVNLERCTADRMTVTRSPSCFFHTEHLRDVSEISLHPLASAEALFRAAKSIGVKRPALRLRRRFLVDAPCETCGRAVSIHRAFDDVSDVPTCGPSCARGATDDDPSLINIIDEVMPNDAVASMPLTTLGYAARDVVEIIDKASGSMHAFRLDGSIDEIFSTIRRHDPPAAASNG